MASTSIRQPEPPELTLPTPQQPTLIEELTAAGRGVLGLLTGNRQAPGYFSFTQRGLAGSFVAFIIVTALNAALPLLLGLDRVPGSFTRALLVVSIIYALQIAFSAIVLRQINRMDALLPYLVADNWGTFFLTLVSAAIAAAGIGGDFIVIVLGIVVLIVEINIARLVMTLAPLQIAMFIIARMVGATVGLFVARFFGLVTLPDLASVGLG